MSDEVLQVLSPGRGSHLWNLTEQFLSHDAFNTDVEGIGQPLLWVPVEPNPFPPQPGLNFGVKPVPAIGTYTGLYWQARKPSDSARCGMITEILIERREKMRNVHIANGGHRQISTLYPEYQDLWQGVRG